MKLEEMQALTRELLSLAQPDNQARVTEILATITDDHAMSQTNLETMQKSVDELKAKNETLREVNTNLFLRVGEVPKGNPNDPPAPEHTEPEITPIAFETLFNEKGDLM